VSVGSAIKDPKYEKAVALAALAGAAQVDRDDERLVQVFKLAELGVMSSSTLHEIRQPLFVIKGYVQMILHESHHRGLVDARLVKVLELVEELENMASTYLDFSRSPGEHMIPLEMRAPVEGALALVRQRLKRARIEVIVEGTSGVPSIRGNFATLQQVIVNLVLNSIDALEQCPFDAARRIWIRMQLAPSGREIELFLADNGVGISSEHADRIFDYFFTTKPEGKGTGLGLAISAEIVQAHGGSLRLVELSEHHRAWSPPPVTMFRLSLPVLVSSR